MSFIGLADLTMTLATENGSLLICSRFSVVPLVNIDPSHVSGLSNTGKGGTGKLPAMPGRNVVEEGWIARDELRRTELSIYGFKPRKPAW